MITDLSNYSSQKIKNCFKLTDISLFDGHNNNPNSLSSAINVNDWVRKWSFIPIEKDVLVVLSLPLLFEAIRVIVNGRVCTAFRRHHNLALSVEGCFMFPTTTRGDPNNGREEATRTGEGGNRRPPPKFGQIVCTPTNSCSVFTPNRTICAPLCRPNKYRTLRTTSAAAGTIIVLSAMGAQLSRLDRGMCAWLRAKSHSTLIRDTTASNRCSRGLFGLDHKTYPQRKTSSVVMGPRNLFPILLEI